jgi:hypothetical protein
MVGYMTNTEMVERLNCIHDALDSLREISDLEGMESKRLTSFLDLLEKYFDPLHEHLNSKFEGA